MRRVQDRLDKAVEHGRERLSFAEKAGDRLWLVASLTLSLARPLIYLGRLEEAWDCLERALEVSSEMGGSAFHIGVRALRLRILLAWGRLDEAAAEASFIDPVSDPCDEVAELWAAQGEPEEAEAMWQLVLHEFPDTDGRLDRTETMVGYARFLIDHRRIDEAKATLAEARDLVADTGAMFHQRLIREAEVLIERSS